MRTRMIRLLLFVFLFSTPICVLEAAGTKAKGIVRDVDTTAGTLTVAVRNSYITVRTDSRTRIFRDGEGVELSDLQVTDKANVKYDARTLLAKKVDARSTLEVQLERLEGDVLAVDQSHREVTIRPINDVQSVTFSVTDDTYITLDGRLTTLDNLAEGYNVGAVYNPETMDAARIQAESYARVRGTVRDVSVPLNTLTIATGDGDRTITLNVPPGTPISLNDRPASLEDLRRGFGVAASYVQETLQAVRIAATSTTEVHGFVRAVDLELDIVTIAPLVEGPPVELHVVESTAITINGERAPLERLQAGMPVRAVYHLVSHEAISIAARTEVVDCTPVGISGSILRVDVEGGQLAIQSEGDVVVLSITNRTEITLNGDPARLGELGEGMRVEARFCRETLTATAVAARSEDPGDCNITGAQGVIARVNLDAGTLAIALSTAETTLTLNITNRTEITLNGRPARLSELRIGMRVEARFCRETLTATVVAAHSEDPGDCTLTGAEGVIQRVNPDAGTLTVLVSNTEATVLTLNVTDRTQITLDGRPARLSDLGAGMRVAVRFCRERLIAVAIVAATPAEDCTLVSAAGVIVRVNPDSGSLSFTTREGIVLTLQITSRTEIMLNGRPARLSDLQPDMRVEARFCRESLDAAVIAARTPDATP